MNGDGTAPMEDRAMPSTGDGWPLGCQARPWLQAWGREAFTARLPEAMGEIARIGFAGFETALACLPLNDPRGFAEASARADGLALCGAHAGGRWWDRAAGEDIPALAERARRLPDLGGARLVVSTQALPAVLTDQHLARLAENLDRLGRACRAASGVQLVYHNHAAEVADDARVLAAIMDRCPPDTVALGADLGWVAHAGMDVVGFIRRFGPRLAHLHVRDVTGSGTAAGFVEVGRGSLDHRGIASALTAAGYHGWLVAESEFTDAWRGLTDPEATARAQLEGMRAVLGTADPSA